MTLEESITVVVFGFLSGVGASMLIHAVCVGLARLLKRRK